MEYRHTQLGKVTIAAFGIATIFLLLPFVGIGTPRPGQFGIILMLVGASSLFYSLTVEISNGILRCHFGPGLIRRRFAISEIEEARSVRNPWYSGWGIRWRPGQYWLWNVSGRQAVELTLKGGKRFRIGTDEPDTLVQAIQTNKAHNI
jgi:hypothetical protein